MTINQPLYIVYIYRKPFNGQNNATIDLFVQPIIIIIYTNIYRIGTIKNIIIYILNKISSPLTGYRVMYVYKPSVRARIYLEIDAVIVL